MNTNKEVKECIKKIMEIFPKSFINRHFELILEPTNNIYFRIDDVENKMDFDCKVIAWLSRPSCKGLSESWQRKIRNGFNDYFGKNFDSNEMMDIYTYLGNDCDRELCKKFITSGFNIRLLDTK